MIATIKEPQLIVNVKDVSMLDSLKQAILLLKGVSSVKENLPNPKMTETDFYKKIDDSLASAKISPCVEMKSSETGAQFLERVLCNTK